MITEEKARQVYSELVECSRHPEVSKARGIVRYYRGLLRSFSDPEDGAPGEEEWDKFGRSVWFSLIMVTAFYIYSIDRSKYLVNPEYRSFVYYQADKHTLGNLCELISHYGGKLHENSFFIEVLEQVRCRGAVALIERLLDEEGLRNCFDQRLYLEDTGRKSGFLECSPTYLSRGEVLTAAKHFADRYSQRGCIARIYKQYETDPSFIQRVACGTLAALIPFFKSKDHNIGLVDVAELAFIDKAYFTRVYKDKLIH